MTKRKPKVPNPADLLRNAINLRLQDADFVNLVRLANSQGMNATRLARALMLESLNATLRRQHEAI